MEIFVIIVPHILARPHDLFADIFSVTYVMLLYLFYALRGVGDQDIEHRFDHSFEPFRSKLNFHRSIKLVTIIMLARRDLKKRTDSP